jgi:hypothetical protein
MGSSILASLSEAGGNDPYHPISGPLPPHLKDDADRVGTRPTPYLLQVRYPSSGGVERGQGFIWNDLVAQQDSRAAFAPRLSSNSGIAIPH